MGINNNNTSSKQSKYKRTMKITGLIASTLMLLLAVMASTASARSIAFPEPQYCCNAYTAELSHASKVYQWRSSVGQTLPFRSVLSNSLQFVAMPTMQSVSHARKVYRKRSSAGYTLPFLSVLLRLQFVATPTMQNVRHASSV